LSKESRPRLIDLALTAISISPSPTPVYLHEPGTKASACTNKDETKTKERKKTTTTKQPPPVKHWEETTPTALKAWRQNPGPNGQGNLKPKNRAGRRRREASPPEDKKMLGALTF
jgi:hypothetical protein